MWRSPEPRFDVASAIVQGGRDYQEDAIVSDFPFGADTGVVVLADGMGGHAAGDVASKIVVTEVFSELKFQSANFTDFESEIPQYLTSAAVNANNVVRNHVKANPDTRGMGATLVSLVLIENRMFWMSIGDSPLYHMRAGKIKQLNEDHSMAPQIDFMVQSGLLDAEAGKNHPDRNCLTSVILGDRVAKSDCPKKPFELQVGDIVVVSSDGLQYLEEAHIQKILHRYRRRKSAEIAGYLLEAIETLADPDQDNVSFAVIKLNHNKPVIRAIRAKPVGHIETHASSITRVVTEAPKADPENAEPEVEDSAPESLTDPAPVEAAKEPKDSKPVIKEVKPIAKLDDTSTQEVEEAAPQAKLAAGGK
ncbi:serine/threonine-protein phosphatase [Loktanella sp. D2R18]|uniref:PP2C family protein-serine/threonine phosphatase n=1 Tax=Rhodobacterales TaxID=204455 RepID=UPI000DEAAE59|nr:MULTISPECIES: protein phosphatase 2C domain-containing protein [Rhodobacterales]MDO6590943.1 protein phosphatase 2C domain-containing protein [Yoonia sp. 1_MG-2023]RBW43355.1 serine/threonine-protein phosphatase [Loktanella sp. D2R18]